MRDLDGAIFYGYVCVCTVLIGIMLGACVLNGLPTFWAQ
jgi:hypothetical protein